MASAHFSNDDLALIEAILATLPAEDFVPGSPEHTGAVHFLLRKFHQVDAAELPQQISSYRTDMRTMNQSLAAWQNEGGASGAFRPNQRRSLSAPASSYAIAPPQKYISAVLRTSNIAGKVVRPRGVEPLFPE